MKGGDGTCDISNAASVTEGIDGHIDDLLE